VAWGWLLTLDGGVGSVGEDGAADDADHVADPHGEASCPCFAAPRIFGSLGARRDGPEKRPI
jgi:hypothetical protein